MAEDCARQAKAAPTEILRADYPRQEQSWLQLARSYELQQRLALFISESKRKKALIEELDLSSQVNWLLERQGPACRRLPTQSLFITI